VETTARLLVSSNAVARRRDPRTVSHSHRVRLSLSRVEAPNLSPSQMPVGRGAEPTRYPLHELASSTALAG
jgi:hypothetical protein